MLARLNVHISSCCGHHAARAAAQSASTAPQAAHGLLGPDVQVRAQLENGAWQSGPMNHTNTPSGQRGNIIINFYAAVPANVHSWPPASTRGWCGARLMFYTFTGEGSALSKGYCRPAGYMWRGTRACSVRALARAAHDRQAAKQPQSAAAYTSCMLVVTELTSSTVSVLEVFQTLH